MSDIRDKEGGFIAREAYVSNAPRDPVVEAKLVATADGNQVAVIDTGYMLHNIPGPIVGKREHSFDDVASFAAWLDRNADGDVADILVGHESIRAYLDPSSTEPERIVCIMVHDPVWVAWSTLLYRGHRMTEWMNQRELHDLIRTYPEVVADADSIMAELRRVGTVREGEFGSEIDEHGATRMRVNTDKQNVTATIPLSLSLTLPCFEGVLRDVGPALYVAEAFVHVSLDEPLPRFRLSCPKIPAILQQARRDVASYLGALLADSHAGEFLIGLGEGETGQRRATAIQDSK